MCVSAYVKAKVGQRQALLPRVCSRIVKVLDLTLICVSVCKMWDKRRRRAMQLVHDVEFINFGKRFLYQAFMLKKLHDINSYNWFHLFNPFFQENVFFFSDTF